MNNASKIDTNWTKILNKYPILQTIKDEGKYIITAQQIKEFWEPRLMTKHDHSVNRPQIFIDNSLSILPITRGSYIIGAMDLYHDFALSDREKVFDSTDSMPVSSPAFIESIDFNNITSEATAINSIYVSDILRDFLNEPTLLPTVNGRMGAGSFSFSVNCLSGEDTSLLVDVSNSQIEIDGGYEGTNSLCLIEAKSSLSTDFLVRQLYYPFRLWTNKITKPIRPVFLLYSNGTYYLFEYAFEEIGNYNSLKRVQYKKYRIENDVITLQDILEIPKRIPVVKEPQIQFPQADSLERIINLCEIMNSDNKAFNKYGIAKIYSFDERQSDYYANAGVYLGLIQRYKKGSIYNYKLSNLGKQIFKLPLRSRHLRVAELILSHSPFRQTLKSYIDNANIPSKEEVIDIMRHCELYRMSENLYYRRSSTVISWINWVLNLRTE